MCLTIIGILGKVLSGFLFSNVFLIAATDSGEKFLGIPISQSATIPYFCIFGGVCLGLLVTCVMLFTITYITSLIGTMSFLLLGGVLYSDIFNSSAASALIFWFAYVMAGFGLFIPDGLIMEVSSQKFFEMNLFLGFLGHQVPIIAMDLLRNGYWRTFVGVFWTCFGFCFLMAVIIIIFVSPYPSITDWGIIQIQRFIIFKQVKNYAPPHVNGTVEIAGGNLIETLFVIQQQQNGRIQFVPAVVNENTESSAPPAYEKPPAYKTVVDPTEIK